MRTLRELLSTWENWSARDTLARALDRARSEEARQTLARSLADAPDVDPLDALRDSTELVALLTGWRWQAVYAARINGASWEEIGAAVEQTGAQAREAYREAIERQESILGRSVSTYREVL